MSFFSFLFLSFPFFHLHSVLVHIGALYPGLFFCRSECRARWSGVEWRGVNFHAVNIDNQVCLYGAWFSVGFLSVMLRWNRNTSGVPVLLHRSYRWVGKYATKITDDFPRASKVSVCWACLLWRVDFIPKVVRVTRVIRSIVLWAIMVEYWIPGGSYTVGCFCVDWWLARVVILVVSWWTHASILFFGVGLIVRDVFSGGGIGKPRAS